MGGGGRQRYAIRSLSCSDQIMKCSKKSSAASIIMYTEEEGIWLNNQPCHLLLTSFQAHYCCSLFWVLTAGMKSVMPFLDKAHGVSQFVAVDISFTLTAKLLKSSDQSSEGMRRKHSTVFSSFFLASLRKWIIRLWIVRNTIFFPDGKTLGEKMNMKIDCFKHFYTTCHWPMDGIFSAWHRACWGVTR